MLGVNANEIYRFEVVFLDKILCIAKFPGFFVLTAKIALKRSLNNNSNECKFVMF